MNIHHNNQSPLPSDHEEPEVAHHEKWHPRLTLVILMSFTLGFYIGIFFICSWLGLNAAMCNISPHLPGTVWGVIGLILIITTGLITSHITSLGVRKH